MRYIDPGNPGFVDAWRRLVKVGLALIALLTCGAVALFLSSGLGRYLIADAALELGHPRLSVRLLKGIVEESPAERYAPYGGLAEAYEELGEEDLAMATIAEAASLFESDPRTRRVHCAYGIAYERAAESLESCQAFAKMDPESSLGLLLLARARYQTGDREGAMEAYALLAERCERGDATPRNCRRRQRDVATLEASSTE